MQHIKKRKREYAPNHAHESVYKSWQDIGGRGGGGAYQIPTCTICHA